MCDIFTDNKLPEDPAGGWLAALLLTSILAEDQAEKRGERFRVITYIDTEETYSHPGTAATSSRRVRLYSCPGCNKHTIKDTDVYCSQCGTMGPSIFERAKAIEWESPCKKEAEASPGVKFRFHQGGLEDSMKKIWTVSSKQDICDLVNKQYIHIKYGPVKPEAMRITKYGYDDRIKWDTHIVTADGVGVIGFTDGPLKEETK